MTNEADRQARFDELASAYGTDLYRFAMWLCGDDALAKDLVQETYLRAWKALDKLNAFIEQQETLTSAREEEEQQQLLRKHARATVLKSLRASTTGKTLPEAVHPLILKRWPTLMFNHFLSNGKENNEWINLVFKSPKSRSQRLKIRCFCRHD